MVRVSYQQGVDKSVDKPETLCNAVNILNRMHPTYSGKRCAYGPIEALPDLVNNSVPAVDNYLVMHNNHAFT